MTYASVFQRLPRKHIERGKMYWRTYRCGWCGVPVDKDGRLLHGCETPEQIAAYLRSMHGSVEELVGGECCREDVARLSEHLETSSPTAQ